MKAPASPDGTPSISQQRADNSVFCARDVTKVYHMGAVDVHALRGIDMDLFEGEFVVLLGPSGSGKSTILNILGGLDVPTAGTIHFHERELTAFDDRALTLYRRRNVGFVFQFYNLIPSLTALENVALITEIAEDPMSPREALAIVGLEDRVDHFPSQLSGGEQQRVAIERSPNDLESCCAMNQRGHSTRRRESWFSKRFCERIGKWARQPR